MEMALGGTYCHEESWDWGDCFFAGVEGVS